MSFAFNLKQEESDTEKADTNSDFRFSKDSFSDRCLLLQIGLDSVESLIMLAPPALTLLNIMMKNPELI